MVRCRGVVITVTALANLMRPRRFMEGRMVRPRPRSRRAAGGRTIQVRDADDRG
jgi:hypothetical protein